MACILLNIDQNHDYIRLQPQNEEPGNPFLQKKDGRVA
jgi:hypothetical protein